MAKFRVGDNIIRHDYTAQYRVIDIKGDHYDLRKSDMTMITVSIYLTDALCRFLTKTFPNTNQLPSEQGIDFSTQLAGGLNIIECTHSFQEYIGIKEHYKFCTKCDKKEQI